MSHIRTQPNISKRAAAAIIDYGIYMTFWCLYIYEFGTPNEVGGYSLKGWPFHILLLTWFIYFPMTESIRGQTIGHMLTQQKVVTMSGDSITFVQSLKRRMADIFELFGTFGLIALITVKNSEHNQRVGDIWANTLVVGGETANCQNCNEQLTLTPEETIKGTFECSECGIKNKQFD